MMNQLHTQESKGFWPHPSRGKKQKNPLVIYQRTKEAQAYLLRQKEFMLTEIEPTPASKSENMKRSYHALWKNQTVWNTTWECSRLRSEYRHYPMWLSVMSTAIANPQSHPP